HSMKNCPLIICLLFSIFSFSQDRLDEIVSREARNLTDNKFPFVIMTGYCIEYFGALGDGFPCGFTEVPVQIITIWKDGKDNYLKRYISANEFSVRTLSDDEDLLNFVRV